MFLPPDCQNGVDHYAGQR